MTKVSELIKMAMRLVGRFDCADTYGDGTLTDEQATLVKNLLYCFNAVADELVRHYFPVAAEESFDTADGTVYFTSFSNPLCKVISVKDADGKPVAFRQYYDRVEAEKLAFTVKYYALHKAKGEDDDSGLDARMGDVLIAYGMAAEYCLINGECALAELWENRYRSELDRTLCDLPQGGCIAPRRWI